MEFKDYYTTMGVSRSASEDEIRKAFRKLARQYHPDVAKNKAIAEEKFKEINEAYEVLGDPEKRRKYDTLGANWNRPQGFPPPPGNRRRGARPGSRAGSEFRFGGTGFSEFFEQFFGRGGGRYEFDAHEGGRRQSPFGSETSLAQRGNDIEGAIMVTLGESLQGSVRSISIQRTHPETGDNLTQTLRVRIPKGVQEGQLIRVAGKGDEGLGGGAAGDLYLRVRFARHPDFQVREQHLYHDLDLAPWDAVLGATVQIPTLEGHISLRVPPNTVRGQQLRVRGQGLLNREGVRGDLYVIIQIQVPTQPNAEERLLWQKLAKMSSLNKTKTPTSDGV